MDGDPGDEQVPMSCEVAPTPGSAWRRALVLAATAFALIAVGAAAPALFSSRPTPSAVPANPGQRSGTLLCIDCEAARRRPLPGLESTLARMQAGASHGRLHLRDDAGELWELLPQGEEAAALKDHALVGRRATLFGVVEPDLHAMRVARFELD